MTNPDYTAIQIVMDRSGSMQTIQNDAEGSLRRFIKDQQDLPGQATIRLAQFDTEYDVVYPSTDVKIAPNYRLSPRGGTALNDAIGRSILDFGKELGAMDEDQRPGQVIFVIITDGMENSSKEFSASSVKDLVKQQQEQWQWNFVFLAANQDAVLTGAGYGFDVGQTMTFAASAAGVRATGVALGNYAAATRSGLAYHFSEEERAAATQQ